MEQQFAALRTQYQRQIDELKEELKKQREEMVSFGIVRGGGVGPVAAGAVPGTGGVVDRWPTLHIEAARMLAKLRLEGEIFTSFHANRHSFLIMSLAIPASIVYGRLDRARRLLECSRTFTAADGITFKFFADMQTNKDDIGVFLENLSMQFKISATFSCHALRWDADANALRIVKNDELHEQVITQAW
jgi:hypothetical protein